MARRGVAVDIARRDDDEEGPPGPRKRPRKDGAAPACDSPLPQRTATVESTQVTPGFTTSWRPFAARRGVEPPPRRGRRNWQKKKLGCFAEPTLKSGASTQPNQTAVGRGKRGGVVLAGKAEGHALPACRVKRAIMNDGRRDLVRRSQSQAGAALQLRHGRTRDTRWRIHDTGNMEQTCRPPDVSSWQSVSSRSGAGRAVHGLRARPRPRWAQAGPSGGSLWSSVGSVSQPSQVFCLFVGLLRCAVPWLDLGTYRPLPQYHATYATLRCPVGCRMARLATAAEPASGSQLELPSARPS